MSDKHEIDWVSCIKVISSFSVVVLHTVGPLVTQYNSLPPSYWWIANLIDSVVRVSVPLFFMISGYLLLNQKTISLSDYFLKRINKVVIPLIGWSVFFIFWNARSQNTEITLNAFAKMLLTPAYFHLWFLYAVTGIYLFIPILKIIINHSPTLYLYYYLALWFTAAAIIPIIEKMTHTISVFDLKAFSGYAGYFILGYVTGRISVTKKYVMIAAVTAIIGIGITASGTYWLTDTNNGTLNEYFYEYLSPNVIALSAAVFFLLKFAFENIKLFQWQPCVTLIKTLSPCIFGIYMVHVVFLNLLALGTFGFSISCFSGNPIYSVPVTASITFALSFVVIVLLQKVPIIRRLVP